MEIEVGEYVRTKENGIIGKIEQIGVSLFWLEDESTFKIQEKSYKHSKNIIDLVEAGDYVNGYYVRKIANYNNELCVFDLNTMQWTPLTEIDVFYSIVTHEQMQSIEYKLEEDK